MFMQPSVCSIADVSRDQYAFMPSGIRPAARVLAARIWSFFMRPAAMRRTNQGIRRTVLPLE
jgi:hypothetical protein